MGTLTPHPPTPTRQLVKMHDGEIMRVWSDGSWRHEGTRFKGKRVRKLWIREKRRARDLSQGRTT